VKKLLAVVIGSLLVGAAVPAVAGVLSASSAARDTSEARPRVQPALVDALAAAGPTAPIAVVARADDFDAGLAAARRAGLDVSLRFPKVAAFAATGTAAAVTALQHDDAIRYVELDRPLTYFDETSNIATRGQDALDGFTGTRTVEQPPKEARVCRDRPKKVCRTTLVAQPPQTVQAASAPVDGSGVTIAVVDSGIDGTHEAFQLPDGTSRVVRNLRLACTVDLTGFCTGENGDANDDVFVDVTEAGPANDTDTMSGGGHGTHVAGIAAGGQVTTSDGRSFHGAAPGARLVGLSVGQSISVSGAAAGLNWVLEHHEHPCGEDVPATTCPPIKVVNNSYGTTGDYDPEDIDAVLGEALVGEGVAMIWANGNGDTAGDGGDGSDNRSNPPGQSPVPGVISVANYDDGGSGTRDGVLDSSSSRGKQSDPLTYPDLAAPGTDITSACKPTLTICRSVPGPDADPYYGTISGTSMATPHIAGIVAQLIQAGRQEAGRELTPAEIERTLETTAYKFTFGAPYVEDTTERGGNGTTSFDKGHGLVDAKAAVAAVRGLSLSDPGPLTAADVCARGRVMKDPDGDGTDTSVDLHEATLTWDPVAKELTASIDVLDLTEEYPATYNGYAFYVDFIVDGHPYFVSATRSMFDDAGTFNLGRPNPVQPTVREALSSAGMRGGFDVDADRITIVLTEAAVAEANETLSGEGTPTLPPLGDGFALPDLQVVSYLQRDAVVVSSLPAGDTAGNGCRFDVPGGSSPMPPPEPEVVDTPDPEATLVSGGTYEWDGEPTLGVSVPDPFGLFEPCDVNLTAYCDQRYLDVVVPAGGATLTITITPDQPLNDYDLVVYGPDGKEIGSSGNSPLVDGPDEDLGLAPNPSSSEAVELTVTQSGIYRIQVNPFLAVASTYHGVAKLT
jgi:serine protease AprX